ncbi:MAG: M23 family metallopeptidase [Dehalococcoidia bacterium]|nr:M23 family metallopeptidase [Dehalococcoidia bacterium]
MKVFRGVLLFLATALLFACSGGGDVPAPAPTQVRVRTPVVLPSTSALATVTATPDQTGPTLDSRIPRPFAWPIAGTCLPQSDALMPNAPRTYRNGVHEGLDFYPGSSCAHVERGTQVLSMLDGTVVRADLDYRDITAQQVQDLAALTAKQGFSDPVTLDIYRGRQVWIDHGGGVVTRCCHLSSIASGIRVGVRVQAGDVLGGVGESGTPEFITAPGTELHLHAEVRIGDSFLGAGLPPDVVRGLYGQLFGAKH